MTVITPGVGGTFKSATAEGTLLEVFHFMQKLEVQTSKNATGRNAIAGTLNIDSGNFSGSYNLPCTMAIGAGGGVSLTATQYLSDTGFVPGAGGTFTATTIEGYLLEVLTFIQGKEASALSNPNNQNLVTGSLNIDSGTYQGGASLATTYNLNAAGHIEISAIEYLS